LLDLRWNNLGLIGGKAIADSVKFNYSLAVLDVVGNDIPDEFVTAIDSIVLRNRENAAFKDREQIKSKTLADELTKLNHEHQNYVIKWSAELDRTKGEQRHQEEASRAQVAEVAARVLEEKKNNVTLLSKYEAEQQTRILAEMRIKELEEKLNTTKDDLSLIVQRFQREMQTERQVLHCTLYD
jgi:hypothetical protein